MPARYLSNGKDLKTLEYRPFQKFRDIHIDTMSGKWHNDSNEQWNAVYFVFQDILHWSFVCEPLNRSSTMDLQLPMSPPLIMQLCRLFLDSWHAFMRMAAMVLVLEPFPGGHVN